VAPYADEYYIYDTEHRVVKSASTGGTTVSTYAYDDSTSGSGFNIWSTNSTWTTPSGMTETDYFNAYGETMLVVDYDGTHYWGTFTAYDDEGNPVLVASPSAVNLS